MNICEHFMTKLMIFCLLVGVVLLSGAPPVAAQNVNIPNVALRTAINKALGENRAANAAVTAAEMKTLTSLSAKSFWDSAARTSRNLSDLTGLEKATNLTTLDLWGSFTDISAVSGLTNLTTLGLSGTSGNLSELSRLTNLTTLTLSGSYTNFSALSRLTNLTTLNLPNGISSTGFSAVFGLTNLTTLTLYSIWLTDISALSGLTNLTTLTLYGLFTNLSAVSSLTNLTSLDLWGSFTDISALSSLTNLTTLTLRGRFTDISALSRLTNLTTLNMSQGPLTRNDVLPRNSTLTCNMYVVPGGAFGQWRGRWFGPDVANVMLTRISDISSLSGLTNLTHLDLTGHNISDISALSGLTNLTHLYLGEAGRVDHTAGTSLGQTANFRYQTVDCGPLPDPASNSVSDISSLSGLTNLTHLYLTDNNVSDISSLSGLTNLTYLDLDDNNVSDISALSGLTKLTSLYLKGNKISDLSPLVSNTGLGTGDWVGLWSGTLSYPSIYTHIPALKTRGVGVYFHNRVPTTLTKVSGDAQTGVTSTVLANPFVVEVKDGGITVGSYVLRAPAAFAGVPVTFAVTGGGGTLSAITVATDATGRAQTTLTPGSTTGTNTVTATVTHAGRTLSVSFTANANNRHPTFTSAATFSVAEKPATTTVGTVVATDADSQDSVTGYTLSGADSATFSITNAGVLTFNASPDYDTPGDLVSTTPANAAGNNEYIVVVTATSGSGARQLTTPQTLTITVTDVNEPPGKPGTPTVTAAATTPTSLNVSWTAPTNTGPAITAYNLQYRKNNEANWTNSDYAGTETRTTLTGLTPGTPYDVQVMAKNDEGDGPWSDSGRSTTLTNAVPTFTSAATFSVAENATAVGTVVATDTDTTDTVTGYTITGGADSSKFAITNAGVLTFTAAPNYETPGDLVSTDPANAAGNNEYILIVTATSGAAARVQSATQTLTITVTNVPAPGKPAAPTVTVASHTSLSATWTAPTNTGPAITDYDVQYRKGTIGTFTPWPHTGTTTTTTITGLTAGTSYQVQVRAMSLEDGPWSAAATVYHAEDVDIDGDVDIDDLASVVSNFGSASPGRNDVDNNGDVDAADIRAVFAVVLAAEAAEAAAGAPALTHTAKTLQHYLQQTKARGVGANFQRGLAVLEELLEPFLIPDASSLLHNYPNPFNPETWLPYQLAKSSDVTFSIYSVNGTLVRTLSLGYQAAGVYRSKSRAAYWDGRNALGEPVASGVYFYSLTAGDFIATGKMLIRK